MLSKTVYSQNLSITKVQRDSIVSKIIRGNEAIQKVAVLSDQIVKRDSVIALHNELYTVCQTSLSDQKQIISNLNIVITNKDEIIKKEKKIARKNKLWGTIKGVGAGIVVGVLLFN